MEQFFSSTAFFIIANLAAIAGSWLDFYSSQRFVAYGRAEARSFNRTERGYFSPGRFIAIHAVLHGAGVAAFFFLGGVAGFYAFAIAAVGFYIGVVNLRKQPDSRKIQESILRSLKGLDFDRDYERVILTAAVSKHFWNGQYFYFQKFAWIAARSDSFGEAYLSVLKRLWELSQKPESEWFADTSIPSL